MMKRFILIVCGSFVGAFLAFLIFLFVGMIMSFAIMGSMGSGNSKKAGAVSKHSILKLDLGANISERGGNDPIDMMSLMRGDGLPSSLGLNTILSAIENAADDDKVDGIYIECNGLSASPATMKTIRRALKEFKKSGKWIAAYGHEGINQTDYYVASVADSIYINPVGALDLHGMASVTPYMKKLFDKVGLKMQVVRVGSFKSAVEPYILDDMSDATGRGTGPSERPVTSRRCYTGRERGGSSWRLGHAETRSSAEHGRVVTSLHTASPTRGRVHAASLARLRGSSAGTLPQAAFCFPP